MTAYHRVFFKAAGFALQGRQEFNSLRRAVIQLSGVQHVDAAHAFRRIAPDDFF